MNYEKKYKNALANARQEYNTTENLERKQWLEELFPELADGEDERIRKAQLDYWRSVGGKEWHGVPVQETIAWLEKQSENKPVWTDNDRTMAFTLMRDVDQITYISEEGKNKRLEWLNSLEDRFNKEK